MSKTRSSEKATEPTSEQVEELSSQEDLQTTVQEQSIVKAPQKTSKVKVEKPSVDFTDEEIAEFLQYRAKKLEGSETSIDSKRGDKDKPIAR